MDDIADLKPTENNWFNEEVKYDGWGRAEFAEPHGHVEGHASVHFSADGEAEIKLTIEKFESDNSIESGRRIDDLWWLLSGIKPYRDGDITFHVDDFESRNKCLSLRIELEDGTFEVEGDIDYFESSGKVITFYPSVSLFKTNDYDKNSFYWVMPLTNFRTQFYVRNNDLMDVYPLDRHPLRIIKLPEIPEDTDDETFRSKFRHLNWFNGYIPFKFGATWAFIEGLPDYKDRADALANSQRRVAVTALMVGGIDGSITSFKESQDWLPFDYLQLLSLATGNRIGSAWIEFRDKEGKLTGRIHSRQWVSGYLNGTEILDAYEISHLLSIFQGTLDSSQRTAMILSVRSTQRDLELDDSFTDLFRAMDSLTKDIRNQMAQSHLSGNLLNQLKSILHQARTDIFQIKTALSASQTAEAQELEQTASRVSNAHIPRRSDEAKAVIMLAELHQFMDFKVIQDHDDWCNRYNNLRNHVIHEGFLPGLKTRYDVEQALALKRHLHDLIVRVLLRQLNYGGKYKRLIPMRDAVELDWITASTKKSELGYK